MFLSIFIHSFRPFSDISRPTLRTTATIMRPAVKYFLKITRTHIGNKSRLNSCGREHKHMAKVLFLRSPLSYRYKRILQATVNPWGKFAELCSVSGSLFLRVDNNLHHHTHILLRLISSINLKERNIKNKKKY